MKRNCRDTRDIKDQTKEDMEKGAKVIDTVNGQDDAG